MPLIFPPDSVILEDNFSSYPNTSIACKLTLTEKVLYINYLDKSNKPESEKISITDMMGCHVKEVQMKSKAEVKNNSACLTIYAYPLKIIAGILSTQKRRVRRVISFQMCNFPTLEENLQLAKKWQNAIICLIRGLACSVKEVIEIPDNLPQRKILILINPKSGPGKACQIFNEQVVPLLAESDIDYELLVTDRANCARDYIKKANLSKWDGIVVVSGDGLLFEVYNGLMARPDSKEAVQKPVGVIPGGSGNGLARTLSHAAGEPYDVTAVAPCVLNIVHGRILKMDLVKVDTENGCFFSFLSVGWGLMADIDIESERLRAIGEARFAVWGVIRALGLRRYKGRLSYLPVTGDKSNSDFKVASEPRPKRSKTIDCHLTWSDNSAHATNVRDENSMFRSKSFGTRTFDEKDDSVQLLKFSYSGENFDSSPIETPRLKIIDENVMKGEVPHEHCGDSLEDSLEEPARGDVHASYCPPLSSPVPEDWVVVDDEFVMVYACHQTHLSTDVFFAPEAKLDDGIMWLVMIKGGVSRAQVIHFLASLQTGEHVRFPFVDVIPIHAFRLEPYTTDGFLTVDGEVIKCSTIQAEVLPSIARVMSL